MNPSIFLTTAVWISVFAATSPADDVWLRSQQEFYSGPVAKSVADLRAYSGEEAVSRLVGEDRRNAYQLNYRQIHINYSEGVEAELRRELAVLCPQTVDLIYGGFTPLEVRYRKGSRPVLEQVVAEVAAGLRTEQEKALALMRFCRDLHRKAPDIDFSDYVYGGTEEQMIDKPEILCETLGRLLVALCEVTGIPGRIVMHVLGGHIGAEVYVDGGWAYLDPRCGMYFRKSDGSLASVLELWRNPSIIRDQPDAVKADVSDQWSWSLRAWKCEHMYFNPREVNGFQNYSLADASRYCYRQFSHRQAVEDGLLEINRSYVRTARAALGLLPEGWSYNWSQRPLHKIDLAYRHDGFSIFYKEPVMDRAELIKRYIAPFEGSNASILVWGLGPGSVFCYETKVGEIFGEGLANRQRAMLRPGDLWVHENVMNLIKEGPGPLQMAVEDAHGIGRKILARLEMNHEYGPASDDNWKWVSLVGSLNKAHPEYRIGKSVLLDFKHEEVRNFKLAILREAVQFGADGVSLDFAVYPPFFEIPDAAIMTKFVGAVRAMLDEEGARRKQRLTLMARVPAYEYLELGLDWETWASKRLVDILVPTHRRPADYFDIRIEKFINVGVETGVKIYPTIWQALGFVDTDQQPGDEKTGMRRYDKPKTKGMYQAQALLFHRAGADGLQLGFSEDQWRRAPWMNDLADPEELLFADKHYMVDPISLRPGTFPLKSDGNVRRGQREVILRVADDLSAARQAGRSVDATVVVYCRPLEDGERLEVYVNGCAPAVISGNSGEQRARRDEAAIDPTKDRHESFIFERNWWKRGEHKLAVPAEYWQLGDNTIQLVYTTAEKAAKPPLSITWVDLILDYRE